MNKRFFPTVVLAVNIPSMTDFERKNDEPVVYTFSMVDHRDTEVQTGVEVLPAPIVRTILVLVIAAGALIAAYFGIVHRRKKNKE